MTGPNISVRKQALNGEIKCLILFNYSLTATHTDKKSLSTACVVP